jgi:hypothetical protein
MSWATVRLEDLPEEVLTLCARHLLVWERICMSQACRALHKVLQGKVLQGIKYGALEQVKNKHYTQAQLVDQYTDDRKRKEVSLKTIDTIANMINV